MHVVKTILSECLRSGNMLPFYKCTAWKRKRLEVLALDHFECQTCKAKGWHTKANYVHHTKEVKKHPSLALSIWYTDLGGMEKRNLVSLCHACHEEAHSHRVKTTKEAPWPERW